MILSLKYLHINLTAGYLTIFVIYLLLSGRVLWWYETPGINRSDNDNFTNYVKCDMVECHHECRTSVDIAMAHFSQLVNVIVQTAMIENGCTESGASSTGPIFSCASSTDSIFPEKPLPLISAERGLTVHVTRYVTEGPATCEYVTTMFYMRCVLSLMKT